MLSKHLGEVGGGTDHIVEKLPNVGDCYRKEYFCYRIELGYRNVDWEKYRNVSILL